MGRYPVNAWGLQDMHGNVWEWCLDNGHENYEGGPIDGGAWLNNNSEKSDTRLLRGGSWLYTTRNCRSAQRDHAKPSYATGDVGFRVVCHRRSPSLRP